MQLLRFIPIRLTLLLVSGILLAACLDPPPRYPLLLAAGAMCMLALLVFKSYRPFSPLFGILAAIATLAIGMFSYAISQPENQKCHYTKFGFNGPHLLQLKIREVWKPTDYARRYVAELQQVDCLRVKGRLLLSTGATSSNNFMMDDLVLAWGALAKINSPGNPYQFSYKDYLQGTGIESQVYICTSDVVEHKEGAATLPGWSAKIRNTLVTRLKRAGMGTEALTVMQALLLGQRTEVARETYTAFINAGAVHVLAVSGLHIGILLFLLHILLRPIERLHKGKAIKLGLLLLLLWGYALLAGLSASIIRAVSMFSFVAYALYLNRPANTYNILALSMFFILLAFNPRLLFRAGFQMSYAAVFAILWFFPLLQDLWRPRFWLARSIWQLASVSIAAQLGVLPISLFYFHQFPALFFISNLLIIPVLGILLGMGFLVALLALSGFLPGFLVEGYEMGITLMITLVRWVSRQEAFIFSDIPFALPELLLMYVSIGCLAGVLARINFRRVVVLLVSIILFQLWNTFQAYANLNRERVWILQRPGRTLLIHKTGNLLKVYSPSGTASNQLLSDFMVGARCSQVFQAPMRQAWRWRTSRLYIMDENAVPPEADTLALYLALTNSPKIHLGRLLDAVHPVMVIADGSNYPSFAKRWEVSCKKRNIPFHNTTANGAYLLPIK